MWVIKSWFVANLVDQVEVLGAVEQTDDVLNTLIIMEQWPGSAAAKPDHSRRWAVHGAPAYYRPRYH